MRTLDIGWLCIFLAVVAFAIAFFAVVFEADEAKLYPASIAAGLALGVFGLKS